MLQNGETIALYKNSASGKTTLKANLIFPLAFIFYKLDVFKLLTP